MTILPSEFWIVVTEWDTVLDDPLRLGPRAWGPYYSEHYARLVARSACSEHYGWRRVLKVSVPEADRLSDTKEHAALEEK